MRSYLDRLRAIDGDLPERSPWEVRARRGLERYGEIDDAELDLGPVILERDDD